MLVYANQLHFPPTCSVDEIILAFANWLSFRVRTPMDLDRITQGIRALRFRDKSLLTTSSTFVLGVNDRYPFLFNASYSHNDSRVFGRRWTLELGVRQFHSGSTVECTILLKTDERSVLVTEPIQVATPVLLRHLLQLGPVAGTPGADVGIITEFATNDFVNEVQSSERRFPLMLLSADLEGNYFQPIERLQQQILGLCQIVKIPHDVDNHKLERVIGRDRFVNNGCARIFWTPRPYDAPGTCPTTLFRPAPEGGVNIGRFAECENPLLAALTDHMNVPMSLRHISREKVFEQVVRSRLERAHSKVYVEHATADPDLKVYQDLLASVDEEIRAKEQEASVLQDTMDALKIENARLLSLVAACNQSAHKESLEADAGVAQIRDSILALYDERVTLAQALEVVQGLFPERVRILASAFKSAQESDAARFQYSIKAAELLITLATKYWEALAGGGADQHAKACFGIQTYSANEAALSARGRAERTFLYQGLPVFMDKHLKIGAKDSPSTTLRIHFEWFSDEKRIVIGHCGRHLVL